MDEFRKRFGEKFFYHAVIGLPVSEMGFRRGLKDIRARIKRSHRIVFDFLHL